MTGISWTPRKPSMIYDNTGGDERAMTTTIILWYRMFVVGQVVKALMPCESDLHFVVFCYLSAALPCPLKSEDSVSLFPLKHCHYLAQ